MLLNLSPIFPQGKRQNEELWTGQLDYLSLMVLLEASGTEFVEFVDFVIDLFF